MNRIDGDVSRDEILTLPSFQEGVFGFVLLTPTVGVFTSTPLQGLLLYLVFYSTVVLSSG